MNRDPAEASKERDKEERMTCNYIYRCTNKEDSQRTATPFLCSSALYLSYYHLRWHMTFIERQNDSSTLMSPCINAARSLAKTSFADKQIRFKFPFW